MHSKNILGNEAHFRRKDKNTDAEIQFNLFQFIIYSTTYYIAIGP